MDPSAENPQGPFRAWPIHDCPCMDAQRLLCSPALADPVAKGLGDENLLIEMMDPAPIPQRADPNPSVECVKAKRLWCSPTPADPVCKVFDDDNTSSSPAPATPLDDEDLLREILLRLPPKPSSLPRASLVCTLWCSILSNPEFLKCFRKHHQKPPLLGFFTWNPGRKHNFVPFLDTEPDRIPVERFAVPKGSLYDNWYFLGCRHSLAVLISDRKCEAVVWDPLTGQQHRVPFPPGLSPKGNTCYNWHAAVLCADTEDGHVHGDCFSSPFKLALTCGGDIQASACLYESASGVWGNIVSAVTTTPICTTRPSVLTRSAVYWLLFSGDILALDIERQGLDVIQQPTDNHATDTWCFQLLQMENGELGLAVLAELTIKLWERKSNCDGVVGWVLQRTIALEGVLPRRVCNAGETVHFVGYVEDTNVVVLATMIGVFTLQLDSMQIKHILKRDKLCHDTFHPYTNFYTAVRGIGWKWLDLKL